MKTPEVPENEASRLESLKRLSLLDTALEERFERVTRLASRLIGCPIAAISLIDSDRQWFKSVQGLESSGTSRDISFCGHTILSDETMIVEDAHADERFHDNPSVTGDPNIRFYAGQPLHSPDGHRIGALCVIDTKPRTLSASELEDLRDLAGMVEVELRSRQMALTQMKMNADLEEARRAVLIDPLTRLWNRSGGEAFLARQLQHAIELQQPFCIAMLDIDHFKKVNDTFGHATGDEVLRTVGRRILKLIREQDFVCRNGGEEFLLILAEPDAAEAVDIAETVREEIASQPIHVSGNDVAVTVSIGMAYFNPASSGSCERVVAEADRCLYRAKGAGRNRVVTNFRG